MSIDSANLYRRTRDARKVIVVDLGFLGDTLHLVPALWELRNAYPQAELHVLTTPLGCEVLGMVPCVHRAWGLELYPEKRSLGQQWRLVRELRRERFDVAFNFSGADRTVFMTALSGARVRVAHPCGRWHFWSRWLIPCWVARQPQTSPVYEQRRQVLAVCGVPLTQPRFDLLIPPTDREWAARSIPGGAIHLSVNASTPLKEWPLSHWVELARLLANLQPGCSLVATGSTQPRERRRLEELAAQVNFPRLQTFAGLPVSRLAALLERCALHVGADSGVLHVAMALGIPTLSLFRNYPALAEWAPRGPRHAHLVVDCPCIDQKEPACAHQDHAACLATLTPQAVAEKVMAQLQPPN